MYAVLFDIDGTLLLTGGAGKNSFLETFREDFQIVEPSGSVPFAGRSDRAIAEELMQVHGIETSVENWQRFLTGYCGRVGGELQRLKGALLPGVVEFLDELGGMKHVALGLLTGNVEHGAWAKLSHYGIADRFAFGGFGEHHTDRCDIAAAAKLAAERHVAQLSNGTPLALDGVMVIGDTIFDVRCAKSIGAYAVGVATGSTTQEQLAASGADIVLPDLTKPQVLLAKLARSNAMPTLTRITVFPIKSLDGIELASATVLPGGSLQHDRRYALVDAWGKFVNGKQCVEIHSIRAEYSADISAVTLRRNEKSDTFSLARQQADIAAWFGDVLGKKCRLIENAETGLPDDCEAPGPTLVSTASLDAVAEWFGLPLEETRRRFRANLEVDAAEPFWEDRLVGERAKVRRFVVGGVTWQGRNVCQRCVVPTRDSRDGAVIGGFARRFSEEREAALPEWSYRPRFDHFYRLAINTGLDSVTGESIIRVGDTVTPIEDPNLAGR